MINNDNVIVRCNSLDEVIRISRKLRKSPKTFLGLKNHFPIYIFRKGYIYNNTRLVPYINWSYHLNLIDNFKDRKVINANND